MMDSANSSNSVSREKSAISEWPLVRGFIRAFSIDYRTLALFRVLIGSIILADLLLRSRNFTAFFTDQGIIPRYLSLNWFAETTYSVYFMNGSGLFNGLLLVFAALLALALVVGYKTHLVTVLSWVMLISLHHRSNILSSGADDLMRLLLFWGMFLPLGARFSFDAALEKHNPYPKVNHFSFATFAILMQTMYVYWVGALLKTGGAWQVDHTAVYFALNAEHFTTHIGTWIMQNFPSLLPLLTRFVYTIELYGPLFLIAPFFLLYFRLPILALLICMHIGFVLLLNVGPFPFVSICSLLLFLPKEVWELVTRKWVTLRSEGITIFYDQHCDFCLKTVFILKSLLILPNVQVKAAQIDAKAGPILIENDSWVVERPDGSYLLKWPALIWLVSRSPIFFWLKWPLNLLQKSGLGNSIYHAIGNRRQLLGAATANVLPWRNSSGNTSWLNQTLACFFILSIFQINLAPVLPEQIPKLSETQRKLSYATGIWQKWNMFAPYPITWTQWPVYEGITQDGQKVDIFRQKLGAPDRTKPLDILSDYSNYRLRKFYGRLYQKRFAYYRNDYVQYECRRWNHKDRPENERIREIRLNMANERTKVGTDKELEEVKSMGTYSCM